MMYTLHTTALAFPSFVRSTFGGIGKENRVTSDEALVYYDIDG